jgi:hypothetical protein
MMLGVRGMGDQTLSYCSPCHYTGCDTATEGNAAFMMYGDPITCPSGSQPAVKPNATPGICDGSQWTCYTPPPCSGITSYLTDPCMSQLTPAQLTQFCSNLAGAWAAGNTQSMNTPLGQKCQAIANGTAQPPASSSSSNLIPGVPNNYLYIGAAALLALVLLK